MGAGGHGSSAAIAAQIASALGWSVTIVAPSPLGNQGSVMNVMSLGRSSDRLAARAIRPSESARAGSVAIDFDDSSSTRQTRRGSVSSPVPVTSWISEDRNSCWRLIRLMSEPSPMLCRTRTNPSALLTAHPGAPGRQVHTGLGILQRPGEADLDPAQRIDGPLEAVEVQDDEMIHGQAGEPLHGLERASRTPAVEGQIEPVPCRRDPLAVGVPARGEVHDGVTRNAHHHGGIPVRIDMHEHGRVRARAVEAAVPLVALAGPLVGAHEQERDWSRGEVAVVDGPFADLWGDVDLRDVALESLDRHRRRSSGDRQGERPSRGEARDAAQQKVASRHGPKGT